jgi:hypothetical protein
MAVIGDLLRSEPLGYWLELTLVVWDLPRHDRGDFSFFSHRNCGIFWALTGIILAEELCLQLRSFRS